MYKQLKTASAKKVLDHVRAFTNTEMNKRPDIHQDIDYIVPTIMIEESQQVDNLMKALNAHYSNGDGSKSGEAWRQIESAVTDEVARVLACDDCGCKEMAEKVKKRNKKRKK